MGFEVFCLVLMVGLLGAWHAAGEFLAPVTVHQTRRAWARALPAHGWNADGLEAAQPRTATRWQGFDADLQVDPQTGHTRLRIDVARCLPTLSLQSHRAQHPAARALLFPDAWETGDAAFDRVLVVLCKPDASTLAALPRRARVAWVQLARHHDLRVEGGLLTITLPAAVGVRDGDVHACLARVQSVLRATDDALDPLDRLLLLAATDDAAPVGQRAWALHPALANRLDLAMLPPEIAQGVLLWERLQHAAPSDPLWPAALRAPRLAPPARIVVLRWAYAAGYASSMAFGRHAHAMNGYERAALRQALATPPDAPDPWLLLAA